MAATQQMEIKRSSGSISQIEQGTFVLGPELLLNRLRIDGSTPARRESYIG